MRSGRLRRNGNPVLNDVSAMSSVVPTDAATFNPTSHSRGQKIGAAVALMMTIGRTKIENVCQCP